LPSPRLLLDRRIIGLLVWVLAVGACARPATGTAPANGGITRTFYIAADEVVWDYAPTGTNLAEGRPFNDDERP
jgi:hephaestin